MKTFKMKFHGMKVKARKLQEHEPITETTYYRMRGTNGRWFKSKCVGETPREHPEREYIEILSPHAFSK